MRGGSHFLCCCKESNQRKQPIRPMGTGVATRDTRGMEQPLSVRIGEEGILARPWLPPRAFDVFGAAAFRFGLALRAQTRGTSRRAVRVRRSINLINGDNLTQVA